MSDCRLDTGPVGRLDDLEKILEILALRFAA